MVDVFNGRGVEITLKNPDDFLKIKETCTRIGVSSREEKVLFQSCHILHKQGRYAIVHFKEMFLLDGKSSNITDNDIARRNSIAILMEDWGLATITDATELTPTVPINQIKILSFKEKEHWKLVSKYTIGNKKR